MLRDGKYRRNEDLQDVSFLRLAVSSIFEGPMTDFSDARFWIVIAVRLGLADR